MNYVKLPISVTGGVTATEPYTIPDNTNLIYAELSVSDQSGRLNIQISFGDDWIGLAGDGCPASALAQWWGSFPLTRGQQIRAIIRVPDNATANFVLIFSKKPGSSGSTWKRLEKHQVLTQMERWEAVASSVGSLYSNTAYDSHQIIEWSRPIMVRQKSGGAKDVELYLFSTESGNILLHTQSSVPDDSDTMLTGITSMDFPFYTSPACYLKARVAGAAIGDELDLMGKIRRFAN